MEDEVVLTPIYDGNSYKYHECSSCKKEMYFKESYLVPFRFEEKIKFCPYCGKKVIRYAKPIYIELPNWDWLKEYTEITDDTYDFLNYKIHCILNDEQRKELQEKAKFGEEYFGTGNSCCFISNGDVCKILYDICNKTPHYTSKNKLEEKYGGKINVRGRKKYRMDM